MKFLLLAAAFCLGTVNFSFGQVKNALPAALNEFFWKNVCNQDCSQEESLRWRANLKFEKHDLNKDGAFEYFLFIDHSDWCGAGSNCDYWIFQKKNSEYILLLNGKNLRVRKTTSNSFQDLVSETPMGFCGRNVQRYSRIYYKFNGREYKESDSKFECQSFTPSN